MFGLSVSMIYGSRVESQKLPWNNCSISTTSALPGLDVSSGGKLGSAIPGLVQVSGLSFRASVVF